MTGAKISPAISVVIPVHNAEAYIDACLASVLAQEFTDYEVVIFNDGSSDGSSEKLRDWVARDSRIRLEGSAARLGAAASSNRVVELARAPLIARIDADDIMLPGRLAAQTAVFVHHPDAVLAGGLAWTIDANGRRVRAPDLARLLRASPFAPFPHSSIMFRRAAWQQIGGYRSEAEKWEDVDFFLRMSACGEVWVLPQPVVEYRQNPGTTRLADGFGKLESAMDKMVGAVSPGQQTASSLIAPAAYRHIGATLLWGGGRPKLLDRILDRADLSLNRGSMALLVWAALAQLAPGIMRSGLRARLALQNRAARAKLESYDAVRWRPGSAYKD